MTRIFLAQSFPDGWGGVAKTGEAMHLYLAERDPQHHSWAQAGINVANMRIYGALAGGVLGKGAMSVPPITEAQTLPQMSEAMKVHLAT